MGSLFGAFLFPDLDRSMVLTVLHSFGTLLLMRAASGLITGAAENFVWGGKDKEPAATGSFWRWKMIMRRPMSVFVLFCISFNLANLWVRMFMNLKYRGQDEQQLKIFSSTTV